MFVLQPQLHWPSESVGLLNIRNVREVHFSIKKAMIILDSKNPPLSCIALLSTLVA